MKFSYIINNRSILKEISLPIQAGKVFLITGIENNNLTLLSGIIAQLFPCESHTKIPAIDALLANFSGQLNIIEGNFPSPVSYVSSDPDRHLLLATVAEELAMQLPAEQHLATLATFGLDSHFLERTIATLSGGEKMKVALALAFAKPAALYILHGVIPWLDEAGRKALFEQINQVKNTQATILFIEHEISQIENIIDTAFWFNGNTLIAEQNVFAKQYDHTSTNFLPKIANSTAETLLEFKNIHLFDHPFFPVPRSIPLLENINLQLIAKQIYALVGENGSGKSTLAQMLFRIIKPQSGTIKFCDKDLAEYSRSQLNSLICYIGQFPANQLTMSTMGQYIKLLQSNSNSIGIEIIANHFNLPEDFPVTLFSQLEIKLLTLATFITPNTRLLIFDEPTWGLDKLGQNLMLQILADLINKLNLTVFIISHDNNFINTLNAITMRIQNGKIFYL